MTLRIRTKKTAHKAVSKKAQWVLAKNSTHKMREELQHVINKDVVALRGDKFTSDRRNDFKARNGDIIPKNSINSILPDNKYWLHEYHREANEIHDLLKFYGEE